MILDNIKNLEKYEGVIPFARQIAAFLAENDGASIEKGRYDVPDTDGVYVNVLDCDNTTNKVYEAHRKYSDLQCVMTGDEIMLRTDLAECSDDDGYNEDGDYILFKKAKFGSALHLQAGEFAFFEPADAHAPGNAGTVDKVRKLVFKIPV